MNDKVSGATAQQVSVKAEPARQPHRMSSGLVTRCYLHFDEMCWPRPDDFAEIEWTLRYGTPSRSDILVAASYISAYKQLVYDPIAVRNAKVAGMRRTLRDGEWAEDARSPSTPPAPTPAAPWSPDEVTP